VKPSVLAEVEGDTQGGNADSSIGDEVMVESIVSDMPRVKLAELTLADPTFATARALADRQSEGYYLEEGLVFRRRLDEWKPIMDSCLCPNTTDSSVWNCCMKISVIKVGTK